MLNEEKYTKNIICNTKQAMNNHLKSNFVNTVKFSDNLYQCEIGKSKYGCNTPIHCGFFTLDNAKYWILNFYYNFMEKCLDVNKFHYVEGDKDSLYFAISGDKNEDNNQGFKHIITDEKLYNENVYKWLPSDFYSSDNSNPILKMLLIK
jgi:hypothetical protein